MRDEQEQKKCSRNVVVLMRFSPSPSTGNCTRKLSEFTIEVPGDSLSSPGPV